MIRIPSPAAFIPDYDIVDGRADKLGTAHGGRNAQVSRQARYEHSQRRGSTGGDDQSIYPTAIALLWLDQFFLIVQERPASKG